MSDFKKYECVICGFIYDEAEGLPDDGIAPGSVYVPHYYDGGALMRLLPLEGDAAAVGVTLRALQPA